MPERRIKKHPGLDPTRTSLVEIEAYHTALQRLLAASKPDTSLQAAVKQIQEVSRSSSSLRDTLKAFQEALPNKAIREALGHFQEASDPSESYEAALKAVQRFAQRSSGIQELINQMGRELIGPSQAVQQALQRLREAAHPSDALLGELRKAEEVRSVFEQDG